MCCGQGTDAAPEFMVSGHKVGANTATALGEAVLRGAKADLQRTEVPASPVPQHRN